MVNGDNFLINLVHVSNLILLHVKMELGFNLATCCQLPLPATCRCCLFVIELIPVHVLGSHLLSFVYVGQAGTPSLHVLYTYT